MAASSEDKDYVHLVTSALAQRLGARPEIMVRNIADFERNYATYDVDLHMKDLFAFDPDLVVLAIGENVPALGSDNAKAQFKAGVMSILRCALAKRHPLVVVRSCFWADTAKDQVLRQACQEAGGLFVDAGPLGREAANAARRERSFKHDGVAGHPGDKGMKALADAIVRAVLSPETRGSMKIECRKPKRKASRLNPAPVRPSTSKTATAKGGSSIRNGSVAGRRPSSGFVAPNTPRS